jgi:protein-L-isoaspartate(D-aspartate) O-methyltransferase
MAIYRKICMFSLVLFTVLCGFTPVNIQENEDNYEISRQLMVRNQLENRGIMDEKVLDAMGAVPRHLFVPKDYRDYAYDDHPLPIGEGQTISQPYVVALMTEMLDLREDDKVLEIGTGSGYQAAVLAEICNNVYSIEIIESLAEKARRRLRKFGYHEVSIKIGDGYKGWPAHAPFDAIIVTCAPTHVPPALKEQLAEGGRLAIPLGGKVTQQLVLMEKRNNELREIRSVPVRFVPMIDKKGNTY